MTGKRICILGISSSGKSTLADKIGKAKGLDVLHLDAIAHIPNTKWERTDREVFKKQHDEFIKKDKWVVEGCYSSLMPQRLKRADVVIFHKFNRLACVYRYIKREFSNKKKFGQPADMKKSISWERIRYILFSAYKKFDDYEKLIKENPHLKVIYVKSFKDVKKLTKDIIG
ncbi:MAG: hypothetical protein LBL47_02870 [Lactobacillus sp.]|jgi:adenylate kinase family enzyme|nr:hypothetical protein [Lactobacillus sp.]